MIKKVGGDDVVRKAVTVDEPKRAEAPAPEAPPVANPLALRKPLRPMKGDGITTEKPRLPSESAPDVAPRRSTVEAPAAKPVAMAPRAKLNVATRGVKGDGMTGKKARVPGASDAPFAVPNGGFGVNIDPALAQQLKRGGVITPKLVQRPPVQAPGVTTQQSVSGPKIPEQLVGVPAGEFYAAYEKALKNGEGWAKDLQAFGKAELARVERTARFSQPVPDRCGTNGSSTMGATRDVGEAHLAFCRGNGEPWAIALAGDRKGSAFQAAVDGFRRAPADIERFAREYRGAVTTGDAAARALQQQASGEVGKIAARIQSEADFIAPEAVDVKVAHEVQQAARAGQPWAVAAKADQAAQVPADLLPITEDSAPAFREAYRKALDAGEPWAVDLKKFAAEKFAELDQRIERYRATAKVSSDQVFTDMRTAALDEARAAGEPWVYAGLVRPEGATFRGTGAPPPAPVLPAEWPSPLPAGKTDEFKAAFKDALKNDEPWARALLDEGQAKVAALEEKLGALPGVEEGRGGARVEQRVAAQVALAAKKGEPWAVAMQAEGAMRLEQAEQKKTEQATNTKFLALPPEVGTGNKKDHNKVKNQSAADGSMKVPSPKEAFVTEYVRTNGIVQALREGGLANVYNPLYQHHLSATVEAAGRGEAPPKGKGFLAMTDHGFAYCYDSSKSPEHNAKLAELSLLSGMTFDQCRDARVGVQKHGDGKFEDALEVFKSFDPTKAGEVKIALDGSAKGKVEIVLKSDGNGGVTSEHAKKQSTWTKIGRAVAQYGLPVAALVCAVVPGLQGVAAVCISTASAVKSVVEGIRNKDWLGAVLGAVGAVGGVLQIAGKAAGGATSALAATGSRISDAAKALEGVRGVIAGIQDKSLSATLLSVANVAGGLASVVPDAKGLTSTLEGIAKHAKQFGELAAFGEAGVAALKNGDYLGAFVAAVKLGATAGKSYLSLDPKVADKLIEGASVMKSVGDAVKNKDWAGAVANLLNGVKTVTGSDSKLLDAGATLAGVAQSLAHSDPAGAASLAMEFIGKLTTEKAAAQKKLDDPATPAAEKSGLAKLLEGVEKQLGFFGKLGAVAAGIGEVVAAVKKKDPAAILESASAVVADLTKSGKVAAAHEIIAAARVAYEAAKSGDQIAAMQAATKLGAAIRTAIDSLHSDKKEPGGVPDPKGAITGTLPPDQAAAAEGYRVKVGDTLPGIAKALLGDSNRWPELYAYNRNALGDDASQLSAGVKLELPPEGFAITAGEREAIIEATKGKLPAGPPAPAAVAAPSTYTTRPGDTLAAIAKRELGSSAKWPELYEYNKSLIGADPNDLQIAAKLTLPPEGFTLSDARRKEILALGRGPAAPSGSTPGATGPSAVKPEPAVADEAMRFAQEVLNAWNPSLGLTENGVLDERTVAALKDFQQRAKLPVTGRLDAATNNLLIAWRPPAAPDALAAAAREAEQMQKDALELARVWTGLPSNVNAGLDAAMKAINAYAQAAASPVTTPERLEKLRSVATAALRRLEDTHADSLSTTVEFAEIARSALDQFRDSLADLTGPGGKVIAAFSAALGSGLKEYLTPGQGLNQGLTAAMTELSGRLSGLLAGEAGGKLLAKLGGKAGVSAKLNEVIKGIATDVVEDTAKAIQGAITKMETATALALADLKAGRITRAEFSERAKSILADGRRDVARLKATLGETLKHSVAAGVTRAFGAHLPKASLQQFVDGVVTGARGLLVDAAVEDHLKNWDKAAEAAARAQP